MGSGVSQKVFGGYKPQQVYGVKDGVRSTSSSNGSASTSSKDSKVGPLVPIKDVVQAKGKPTSTASADEETAPAPPPPPDRVSPPSARVITLDAMSEVSASRELVPKGPPSPCKPRSVDELKARLKELVGQVPTSVSEKSELMALVEEAEHRASLKAMADEDAQRKPTDKSTVEPPRSPVAELLPPPWIKKESRSNPGFYYYVNVETNEATWDVPEFLRQLQQPVPRRSQRSGAGLRPSFNSAESFPMTGQPSNGHPKSPSIADVDEDAMADARPRVSARRSGRGVAQLDLLVPPACNRIVTTSSAASDSTLSQSLRLPSTPHAVRTVSGQELRLTWAFQDVLGRGSMGTVFKALDQLTGQFYAVKEVVVGGGEEDEKFVTQLENEINIMKELSHPHIVRYVGHDYINDSLYMYMEHMPGGTLKQAISQFGHFDELLIAGYSRQLLAGLDYLHGQTPSVIHGDLKSSNILLGADTRVKLGDFGCSRRATRTVTATLRGSIPWMAPEVLAHCHYSCASDIWSFGCVCIEMGTGKQPWGSFDNQMQAFLKIGMSQEIPPLPENMSEECQSFIRFCVQREVAQRPATGTLLEHKFVYGIRLPQD